MKKLAALPLLGVSALSLGLVGLSVATPVVNAAVANTQDSTFSVRVNSQIGIDDEQPGDADSAIGNVTLALDPLAADQITAGGYTLNNAAAGGTLTVKDKDTDTNLKNGDTLAIPTQAAKPVAGKAGWAIGIGKKDAVKDADYKAMVASDSKTPINVASNLRGRTAFYVTYAAATAADSQPGPYTDTVTYSFTAQ